MCRASFFFFKQKTAYEMRISDWSSDVCSSDLHGPGLGAHPAGDTTGVRARAPEGVEAVGPLDRPPGILRDPQPFEAGGAFAKPDGRAERGEGGEVGRASGRERVCQSV